MNIYIIIEHKKRELYSKLLLGFESALKGNQVYVGNMLPLIEKGYFKPGIVHLKSITPSSNRIFQMKFLKKKGFIITSLDEEVGVIQNNNKYVNLRYGNSTLGLVDRLFTHGNFDIKNLTKKFPKKRKKFVNSGNPRFDFWRDDFKNFFKKIDYIKIKNYFLFSSNLNHVFTYQKLEKNISIHKNAGYFERGISEKFLKSERTLSLKFLKRFMMFLDIINKNFKNLHIIIRPHPTENPLEWKKFIGPRKNVEIIGEGNLSDWITYSKCVIHGGCTSGLEAVARGKVAIDINSKNLNHGEKIPYIVSQKIQNKNHFVKKISDVLKNESKKCVYKHKSFIKNRVINISKKPAYKVINETWEEIGRNSLFIENSNFIIKIEFFFKRLIKSMIGKIYKNHKFQKFSSEEIEEFKRRISLINSKFKNIKFEILKDDLLRLYK